MTLSGLHNGLVKELGSVKLSSGQVPDGTIQLPMLHNKWCRKWE